MNPVYIISFKQPGHRLQYVSYTDSRSQWIMTYSRFCARTYDDFYEADTERREFLGSRGEVKAIDEMGRDLV